MVVSARAGRDFAEAMGLADTVLEVAITANRADCLSLLGIAREVSAITGAALNARIRFRFSQCTKSLRDSPLRGMQEPRGWWPIERAM